MTVRFSEIFSSERFLLASDERFLRGGYVTPNSLFFL